MQLTIDEAVAPRFRSSHFFIFDEREACGAIEVHREVVLGQRCAAFCFAGKEFQFITTANFSTKHFKG
jgi:hypothetical protein